MAKKEWFFIILLGLVSIPTIFSLCFCIILNSLPFLISFIGWILLFFTLIIFCFRSSEFNEVLKEKERLVISEQENKNTILRGESNIISKYTEFYSNLSKLKTSTNIFNAVIEFLNLVDDTIGGTILLIHFDHNKKRWAYRMSGNPIYLLQLQILIDEIKENIKTKAGNNSFIISKTPGITN